MHKSMRPLMLPLLMLAMLCLLAACGGSRKPEKLLDKTLDQFAAAMRWGSVDDALAFLAPDAPRPSAFDLERRAQLSIVGYREQPPLTLSPTEVEQIAQIEVVNRHTQEGRSGVERMRWRFDETAQRWWLTSGLPKLQATN
jgi:hypothetical protein